MEHSWSVQLDVSHSVTLSDQNSHVPQILGAWLFIIQFERGHKLKGYRKYFLKKALWFAVTFVCAFLLNFFLPRLMPGDPVAAIVARLAQGQSNSAGVQAIYQRYTELFGTNKPMLEQFFIYVKNVFHGDFGYSFSQYPRTVANVLKTSVWWTVGLQFPAIIVGFFF